MKLDESVAWTGGSTDEHFPRMGKLKAAGCDGVEIPVFGGAAADYKPIRAELDKQGLKCTAVTILTKETNAVSPDAATRQKASDWLKSVVEINHVLGSETLCGPYHSAIGEFSGSGPTADEKKRSADVLRGAAELAKQANLMMAIEYLNRFECYFLNTAVAAVELVKMVNHPNPHDVRQLPTRIEEKDPARRFARCARARSRPYQRERSRHTGHGPGELERDLHHAERGEVRRLADHRGLRPGIAGSGGRDESVARSVPLPRGRLHEVHCLHQEPVGTVIHIVRVARAVSDASRKRAPAALLFANRQPLVGRCTMCRGTTS